MYLNVCGSLDNAVQSWGAFSPTKPVFVNDHSLLGHSFSTLEGCFSMYVGHSLRCYRPGVMKLYFQTIFVISEQSPEKRPRRRYLFPVRSRTGCAGRQGTLPRQSRLILQLFSFPGDIMRALNWPERPVESHRVRNGAWQI